MSASTGAVTPAKSWLTRQSFGKAYTLLSFGVLVPLIVLGFLSSRPNPDNLMNFGSFMAAGRAAAEGSDPYGIYPLTHRFELDGVEGFAVNLNPPISVLFFQVVAALDLEVVRWIWYGGSLVLYAVTVGLLVRSYPVAATSLRITWAWSLAGLWSTLVAGQIYIPLAFAAVVAWLLLRQGRQVAAGVFIGVLVAAKPNFLVWPVLLLLAGYWGAGAAAFISFGGASLLPVLVYGPDIYRNWLAVLSTPTWMSSPTNASLYGLASRLGVPMAGSVLSVGLLLVAALWAWRYRPPVLRVASLGLVCSLLSSPIAWTGYLLVLLPIFFEWRRLLGISVAAALLVVSDWFVLGFYRESPLHFAVLGFLSNWALLLVLVTLVKGAIGEATSDSTLVVAREHILLTGNNSVQATRRAPVEGSDVKTRSAASGSNAGVNRR